MKTVKSMHQKLLPEISDVCLKYSMHTNYLFGSREKEINDWLNSPVRPLQSSSSDIDLGVRLINARSMDIGEKVRLTQVFESLFQEQQVDLVFLEEADPFLAVNVIRGSRLYTIDSYIADEYELYLLRRAADLAPFERARQAMILDPSS
jgi:predicted nucleotidyltransferase